MLHSKRVWRIQAVNTAAEVAAIIAKHESMVLCTGFKVGNVTLLNDSTSEDSLQEYALCVGDRQVDSVTTSWCKPERLAEIIQSAIDGHYDGQKTYATVDLAASAKHGEDDPDGMCPLCA